VALEAITRETASMLAEILADQSVRSLLYAGVRGVSAEMAGRLWAEEQGGGGDEVRRAALCRATRSVVGGVGVCRGELSFFVARARWGQGYGHAMVRAFLEQLEVDPRAPPLVARVQRENLPSRCIVERLGFELRRLERRPDGLPSAFRYERRAGA
jgi:RimJ/RimL family protein N-acetyltransferase